MINLQQIDKTWTLFLDRDGVINHEKHEDYIHTWDEFIFYENAKEAIKKFAAIFKYVIIITNQRGVGKGVTKIEDLTIIHNNLTSEIKNFGGRIDRIYFCPDVDSNSQNRKPNTGMALQAKNDFPDIDFSKVIMIGNTLSDMEFGRNIGAKTVFLPTTRPDVNLTDEKIDAVYPSLMEFAKDLKNENV